MGKILIVLGCIIIIMGLVLTLALPVAGILAVLFGVASIIYGKKLKPKKEDPEEEMTITPMEKFPVAGFDYYQEELKEFLTEPNLDYNSTDIDKEYEFYTEWLTAELKDEPENEFDSGAIAVYVQGVKIGYVAKKDQQRVRDLGASECDVEIYGGRFHKAVFDEYGEFEKMESGESPYKAMLYIKSL